MTDTAPSTDESVLPVTVLTGFLGSGKTTILARLLTDPGFSHTAVIVNEFGEIGLDHELLEQSRDELVLLSNGCVCCTVRGDLVATLQGIAERRVELKIDRVVIETTGLADPAPILHTLVADPSVTRSFRLEHLVTTVDAFNGGRTLRNHPVAQRQAAMADRLVITKADLVDDTTLRELKDGLHSLNQFTPQNEARHGEIDPALLFSSEGSTSVAGRDSWLGERNFGDGEHSHDHDHDHDHEHGHDDGHVHQHGFHDTDIQSYSIVRHEPLSLAKFQSWLQMITAMRGADLLRVKGIVHVSDHPDRPIVVHGVQHIFHPPRVLDRWPGPDRRTRLVFITRDIARDDIDATLQIFE